MNARRIVAYYLYKEHGISPEVLSIRLSHPSSIRRDIAEVRGWFDYPRIYASELSLYQMLKYRVGEELKQRNKL